MGQKLNIEQTVLKVKGSKTPLVIRTDSIATSDILCDVCENLFDGAKKVSPGVNEPVRKGLNIVYSYIREHLDDVAQMFNGLEYIIVVDRDNFPEEEETVGLEVIDCVNDEALTSLALARELEQIPYNIFVLAAPDSYSPDFTNLRINSMVGRGIVFSQEGKEFNTVGQLLEDLSKLNHDCSIVAHASNLSYFYAVDEYNDGDSCALILFRSVESKVEELISRLK